MTPNLLILPIYHANLQAKQIFNAPEVKQNSKTKRVWNIKQLQHDIGEYVCDHILFIHSILGSDTVSYVHAIGKGVASKRMKKEGLIITGQKALVCLHNGYSSDSLDTLRYK